MARRVCVIYVRMSKADLRRARQEAHGDLARLDELIAEKLAMHQSECRSYARDEGWEILGEYTDNMVSGSSRYRRASQELTGRNEMLGWLEDYRAPVTILSTEVERLYRDMDESRVLVKLARRTPITVVSTDDESYDLSTANGEAAFEGAVSKSQRESGKVSERRRRRERRRAEEGGYWGNEPFGYHKVYDIDPENGQRYFTGRLVRCDAEYHGPLTAKPKHCYGNEADQIRTAAKSVISGHGALKGEGTLRHIALEWDRAGIRARAGKPWTQLMIRALLLNPRIKGVRVHRPGDKWGRAARDSKGSQTAGMWPAILDEETFDAVHAILTDPARAKHLQPARRYMLTGLVHCGECGARMRTGPSAWGRQENGERKRQYVCPAPPAGCGRVSRSMGMVDDYVLLTVRMWVSPGGPYELHRARARREAAGHVDKLTAVRQEEKTLQARRDGLAVRLAREGLTETATDTILQAADLIEKDLAAVTLRKVELDRALRMPALEVSPDAIDTLTGVDVAFTRDFLRVLIDQVIIRKAGPGNRRLGPSAIKVVPGRWADGLDHEIADCEAPVAPSMLKARESVTGYLAGHPWVTAMDVATAVGRNWSYAYKVLDALEADGTVQRYRTGHGRGGGKAPMRFALAAADPADAEKMPGTLGRTHCLRGHPFDEANTHVRPDGRRLCRTCARDHARRYRQEEAVT